MMQLLIIIPYYSFTVISLFLAKNRYYYDDGWMGGRGGSAAWLKHFSQKLSNFALPTVH